MRTTTEIVARAVIRRNGQLLVARQHGESWSFLPGGHVEPGERVETALVRKLDEELGTEAKIAGFGVVEHGYTEDGTTHHEINLVSEVAVTDTEPVSREDHLEFRWLPLGQLAEADVRVRAERSHGRRGRPHAVLARLQRLRRPTALEQRGGSRQAPSPDGISVVHSVGNWVVNL